MAESQQIPCVFCAISEGKIPAKKVYEDGDSLAFLDINPRSKGMSVVVPKRHYAGMNDEPQLSSKVLQASQNVAKMLQDSLGPESVCMLVMPSPEIRHFHVKLYPVYPGENPVAEAQPFKMGDQDLESIAAAVRSVRADMFAPAKKEEAHEAPQRSEEEATHIRKQLEIA